MKSLSKEEILGSIARRNVLYPEIWEIDAERLASFLEDLIDSLPETRN